MRIVGQTLVLLALSAAAALGTRLLSPTPLPWRQAWSQDVVLKAAEAGLRVADVAQTRKIVDAQQFILLDARPRPEYLAGHLPGSLSLPAQEMERYYGEVSALLTPAQPILVYCSGLSCDESLLLAKDLQAHNLTNVWLFAGGMKDWQAAGLPVEK